MKDRLVQTAEQLGWIVTDDFQILKRVTDTKFIVVEANPLSNTDAFVVSKPMCIELKDHFKERGESSSDFDDELSSIILSFYESIDRFEEAYEGDINFRNQLLAEMIYESTSELNPQYGKVDKDYSIDYLCDRMEFWNQASPILS